MAGTAGVERREGALYDEVTKNIEVSLLLYNLDKRAIGWRIIEAPERAWIPEASWQTIGR